MTTYLNDATGSTTATQSIASSPVGGASTAPISPTDSADLLASSVASDVSVTSASVTSASLASASLASAASAGSVDHAQSATSASSVTADLSSSNAAAVVRLTATTPSQSQQAILPSSNSSTSIVQNPSPLTTKLASGTPTPTPSQHQPPAPGHRLANGAVAGVVIAAAIGLAFATFLVTFLVMRRRPSAGNQRQNTGSRGRGGSMTGITAKQSPSSDLKESIAMETFTGPGTLENYIPQSADDKTVQGNVKTTLEQIEMHVENFYQSTPRSGSQPLNAEIDAFNSPFLPNSLSLLLPHSRNAVLLIKHALAQFVISSISLSGNLDSTLLPDEFVLVPSTVKAARTGGSVKPGSSQVMSRWRVLTAYLRPTTLQDPVYIAQRDHQINEMGQAFSRAFAPWKKQKYNDEERIRSLFAILKSAADLGIFIFSQPSELQFHWPKKGEVGANSIVVAPALVKTTDERGQTLTEPQVMLQPVIQRI